MSKILIWVFAFLVTLVITVSVKAQPAPSFSCAGGAKNIYCQSKATWNAWVTWRVYIVNGPDIVQVAENSGGYNASVQFYLSNYVSIIEMEVAGQKLRLYAHRTNSGIKTWRYDGESTTEAEEDSRPSSPPSEVSWWWRQSEEHLNRLKGEAPPL